MATHIIDAQWMGKRLVQARKRVGWSLQKFSEELEQLPDPENPERQGIRVGRAALGKWETGANHMPVRYLVPVAALLGVTPTWLLLGDGQGEGESWADDLILIGDATYSFKEAWEWALGEGALPGDEGVLDVLRRGRPHDPPSMGAQKLAESEQGQKMAAHVIEMLQGGASQDDLLSLVRLAGTFASLGLSPRDL